jgi:hypothetical protein
MATPVELSVAGSASLIGRVSWWGVGGYSEPHFPSHWPLPPIYGTARWGPTSHAIGLGASLIRTRDQGSDMAVGPSPVEINLTQVASEEPLPSPHEHDDGLMGTR